jgi:hypothetical protein
MPSRALANPRRPSPIAEPQRNLSLENVRGSRLSYLTVTKPYEFIGFGVMDVTKHYEFIGLGAMDVTKPYEFIEPVSDHILMIQLPSSLG